MFRGHHEKRDAMETNETILTRKVVGLDDRKVLGKIGELRVDCDTLGVCHYVVSSSSTNSSLVLPFEKALAVGDTFLTVQGRSDFLPASDESSGIVRDGFKLIGVEAYSKTGNKLGTVASFGFDTVHGTVDEVVLDSGATFEAEQFVFFAPEFVFVDDGEKTAVEQRDAAPVEESDAEAEADVAVEELDVEEQAVEEPVVEVEEQDAEEAFEDDDSAEGEVFEDEGGEDDEQPDDEDAELVAFLLGKTLTEDVASADGAFLATKGTELTQKIVDAARAHDALLMLTMSVDE